MENLTQTEWIMYGALAGTVIFATLYCIALGQKAKWKDSHDYQKDMHESVENLWRDEQTKRRDKERELTEAEKRLRTKDTEVLCLKDTNEKQAARLVHDSLLVDQLKMISLKYDQSLSFIYDNLGKLVIYTSGLDRGIKHQKEKVRLHDERVKTVRATGKGFKAVVPGVERSARRAKENHTQNTPQ